MRGESETKRRGSAPIPQLAQGVFPLCPFNPAEIKVRATKAHRRLIEPDHERYLYAVRDAICFGYGVEGYLEVSPWNSPPPPETTYSVKALYAMIDEQARNIEIEDVPVRFTVLTSPQY
ncbi:MAG: hypothetical protein LLF90_04455 [Methanomicrobiaceae archaeon]|uniref:hypothetical protein n=1 Tax=Methanoculleus sp. TaxID=90427 RepID=UPI00321170D0|nr:hypothetical protein [Methanomicrobiaceae archaeon]